MADKDARLKVLTQKREGLFERCQILYDLSRKVKVDSSSKYLGSFKTRYQRLEATHEEFCKIHDQISELTLLIDPTSEISNDKIFAFEELYYQIREVAESSCVHALVPDGGNKIVKPKLPTIEIPKFNGELRTWPVFYDNFKSLIHDNVHITPVEKFHYLMSAVSGPALSVVRSLPLTEANYAIVWTALVKKYQSKRVLAATFLDSIVNHPSLTRETADGLNKFLQTFYESVVALKTLKLPDLFDFVLVYLASRQLPANTVRNFELQVIDTELPTFDDLVKFIQNQIRVLEITQPSTSVSQDRFQDTNKTFNKNVPKRAFLAINKNCFYCKENHTIYKCPGFLKLTPEQRKDKIKNFNLCFNCLKQHNLSRCNSVTRCYKCNSKHHTLLHFERTENYNNTNTTNTKNDTLETSCHLALPTCSDNLKAVLLGTAVVRVQDGYGEFQLARVLIDSCAQSSFITVNGVQRLKLPVQKRHISLAGLGETHVNDAKGVVDVVLKPRHNNGPILQTQAVVLKKITNDMPVFDIPESVSSQYSDCFLADPNFDKSSPIDILLGADVFVEVYDGRRFKISEDLPLALHSIFGWVITGGLRTKTQHPVSTLVATCEDLDGIVRRFWEIDEIPTMNIPASKEDELAESIFRDFHYRTPKGRYVVPLLLKENSDDGLGDSYKGAIKRLASLERRLNKNYKIKESYSSFLKEYADLGHMTLLNAPVVHSTVYYIPHHCVFKNNDPNSKIRVVFDASMKTTTGRSLNDLIFTGPKMQSDIVSVLTGFRFHRYVFTTDIVKMFRQILIRPDERRFQHILWKNSSDGIVEYELDTVTYGIASSPYLSIRVLRQLALDEERNFPMASVALKNDTYVDDIITGSSDLLQTIKLRDELISILQKGGFELGKWSSNHPDVLASLPIEDGEEMFSINNDENSVSILGLHWQPKTDVFIFTQNVDLSTTITKRTVLSSVAKFFDPLGWISPIVFKAKCFIQTLWKLGLDWDDRAPLSVQTEWRLFVEELEQLTRIQIPRYIYLPNVEQYMVGFCDASSQGYAAVVYLLVVDNHNNRKVSLLASKTRVAPLRCMSIPRLELCSSVLLVRLLKYILDLRIEFKNTNKIYAFTDSTTVLAWLKTPPHLLKTFVANRVVEILECDFDISWNHVPTDQNAADCASRGLLPAQLINHPLWWSGPDWLLKDFDYWPITNDVDVQNVPELKQNAIELTCCVQVSDSDSELLEYFSSYTRLLRATAIWNRFAKNCRVSKDARIFGSLTLKELNEALTIWVKYTQNKYFSEDIDRLMHHKKVARNLMKLKPFVDSLGFLRVGGRLENASLADSVKHPLLLPKNCKLTNLIVDYYHVKYLHAGPRTVQSLISRTFWIISIRNILRSRLSKCRECFKFTAQPVHPQMASLPKLRVTPTRAFLNVGLDFGGPFTTKESNRRKAITHKSYLCLFVCMSTKAVHLEIVSDLSTEAFLAAFNRFVSRRGLCANVFSDCGKNFVGARRHLSEVFDFLSSAKVQETLSYKLSDLSVNWNLNPPYSPHFGGLWEAGVRSVKHHLKRVVGEQILTFEELGTIFTKIEAVLNSRPLCQLSTDPIELDVLTPGHFLIGGPLVGVPDYDVTDIPDNRLNRWQLLQRISQSFWKKWSVEYLHTLQQRNKWLDSPQNLNINDLVCVKENNLPMTHWRIGRITETFPGSDGVVRVVNVRTAKGTYKRPVVKLCPLPVQ